jgi:deferrochelatase/peroxidase EfeB
VTTSSTHTAAGVLPDAVSRDRNSNGYLFAIALQPGLDAPGAQAWLTDLTGLLAALEAPGTDGVRVATAMTAFGASFFQTAAGPRFGLTATQVPAGLATPPSLPALANVPSAAADVLVYVMSTSEAAVAMFERGLSATRSSGLASVTVELGFQRFDHREAFGFPDGLRNVPPAERPDVVFVNRQRTPEEPVWAAGGSYVAYMKIAQNLDAMAALSEDQQELAIGRRKQDGSRLDLPPGTPVSQESEFAGDACPVTSHVRKVGPRGTLHDETRIFRRGVPYLTLNADGSIDTGLQFVSFQRSLADFALIFGRWMTNVDFPTPGTGQDALLAGGLITIEKAGFFFAPPRDERYIGAPIFDPPPPDPCTTGHIVVQKQLVDANGAPVLAELGNIAFQVLGSDGQPVGGQFTTDSTGRAISPPVPRNQPLVIHEVAPPTGFQQIADVPVTLTQPAELVQVVNHQPPGPAPTPIYSS